MQLVEKRIISLHEIIEKYATPTIKDSYKKTGKLATKNKQSVLQSFARYCEYKELSNNRYRITRVFKTPVPTTFTKLNDGLYKYLAPIVLNKLLTEHDETNKIVMPLMDYARHIEMINDNYKPMKYNQEATSEYLGVNNDVIREYFDKMDDNIKYYIQRCLDYLQSADVLKWYKVPMVRKKKKETIIQSNGNIMIRCYYEDLRATPEEVNHFNTVFEDLRKEMNIKSKSECFYGSKALKFCKSLSEKLNELDIQYFYDGYEIYYTSLERCENLLQTFENYNNTDLLTQQFNETFISSIVGNAEQRQLKELKKELSESFKKDSNYIANFKILSETTINQDVPKVKLKKQQDQEKEMLNKFENDFPVEVIKTYDNRKVVRKYI